MYKFDQSTYDADTLFKVYSQDYYKCLIKNNQDSKDACIKAREDWTVEQPVRMSMFEEFWGEALHNNQRYKDMIEKYISIKGDWKTIPPIESEEGMDRFKGTVVLGMYRRSDDKCVGWAMSKTIGKEQHVLFNALIPEFRHNQNHTNMETAMIKFLFDVLSYDCIDFRIPILESNEKITWVQMSEYFNPEDREVIDRGYPVRYANTRISRDSYNVFINQPENAHMKNAYFEYEHLYLS